MALAILLALVLGVLWLGVFGLGAFVTWRGVRGRVVDAYPRCVQCCYVIGVGGARPDRCPECGTVLRGVGTVSLGMRRARPPLIASGALIMLLSLTPSALFLGPSTPPAVAVAKAPAVRPMTAEQAALLRQKKKDAASTSSQSSSGSSADEIVGRPAPAPDESPNEAPDETLDETLDETWRAYMAGLPGSTLELASAPPDHDWMMSRATYADPTVVVPNYGAVASPDSPAAPDAGYASAIDQEITLDFGADLEPYLGEHELLRDGLPRARGSSALRFGRDGPPWESGFPSTGAAPFTGTNRLTSARIDHRVIPTYIGARPGLRSVVPSSAGLAPVGSGHGLGLGSGLGSPGPVAPGVRAPVGLGPQRIAPGR